MRKPAQCVRNLMSKTLNLLQSASSFELILSFVVLRIFRNQFVGREACIGHDEHKYIIQSIIISSFTNPKIVSVYR